MSRVSASTRIFAVTGDPVHHSLSPLIHNFWLERDGRDAIYVALHLVSDRADLDLAALARFGVRGLNVTLPHKLAALSAATIIGPEARAIGAANTLFAAQEQKWRADNTDAIGFASWLDEIGHNSGRVLLIGAGGAARAVAFCLHRAGSELVIANRTFERARLMATELAPQAEICGLEAITAEMERADLVINATSMGHDRAGLDFPRRNGALFMDLSYGAPARDLLKQAEAQAWSVEDGLCMLVAQAAASYRIWFGSDPDQAAALRLCRQEQRD